jgi:hypothetical protein
VTTGNDEPRAFLRESSNCRSANAGQRTCDQDDGIAHLELRFCLLTHELSRRLEKWAEVPNILDLIVRN